jgi:DNA repair exonuclease SbcCD ATPase subunit
VLVSAHLVNVCQHVDEAFDFDGRLVAVVGGNGTGKTNLLRATLYALTGDLHRLGRAGAAVSFSRSDRRPAVTLTVRPDPADPDAEAVLTRRLPDGSRSADRKLVYRGETLTTDDDIAAVVRGWFGVPPKALGDYVFVDQGTLTAVLDGAPADRRKAVDRLIGLDRAEAVWAALGEWLDANRPVVVDEALLADAKARYAAAAARVSAGEAALAVIPRPDPAAVAAHEGVIRRHAG